jgi:hypothetical protein
VQSPTSGVAQLFWLGGHFVEAEVGGGQYLLKLLHFRKGKNCTIKINKYKLHKIVAVLFNLFIMIISYNL